MGDDYCPKVSICPIWGYTAISCDVVALYMAIEEHIRMAHNLDPATLGDPASLVKLVSNEIAAKVSGSNANTATIPVIATAVPNLNGVGVNEAGAGYSAGTRLLAAKAVNDTSNDTPTFRADITSRF